MDKALNWNSFAVAMCILLTTTKCSEVHGNEPRCSSRFDFEAKLLERTITTEVKMKQMDELLRNMEAAWKLQETEIHRLKSEIANERAEMKENVAEVIDTAHDQVARMSKNVAEVIDTAHDQVARMSKDVHESQAIANTSIRAYFQEQVAAGGGATYTRWGRTVCPGNATTIYAGIAAGSLYTNKGGTSTVLCLPRDPIFGNYQAGNQGSYVYSVEFRAANTQTAQTFGSQLYGGDVPCVVCEATGRRSKILVPARNLCYSGWHLEYSGYLMTSYHTHQRVEAVCVDGDTEVVAGQSGTNNGGLFYFIEAAGQIPDDPYTRGKEFTCAVCTK